MALLAEVLICRVLKLEDRMTWGKLLMKGNLEQQTLGELEVFRRNLPHLSAGLMRPGLTPDCHTVACLLMLGRRRAAAPTPHGKRTKCFACVGT